jgi:uncharacterized membrane protein
MTDERKYWLDEPKNVNKIVYTLYGVCVLLILVDFVPYKHHLHYGFENWIGFYGIYGFVACVALVLAAKVLRLVLMRGEDYYDE